MNFKVDSKASINRYKPYKQKLFETLSHFLQVCISSKTKKFLCETQSCPNSNFYTDGLMHL